jgi:hypothetical protein
LAGQRTASVHLWDVVGSAGLHQQHLDVRILGEPARHDRAGRTRSTDDEIVVVFEGATKLALIQTNTFVERRVVIR